MSHPDFNHPLSARYASADMLEIFSDPHRYGIWRRAWLALAESQAELGLDIPAEAIEQMRAALVPTAEDFASAKAHELRTRHDVMAHVHAFAERAPAAAGILHLGATSCFIGDNTDLVLWREALQLIRLRLLAVIKALAELARKHRDLPVLGHTHFQPAQPTTFGKRVCLWLQDFVQDLERLDFELSRLRARGVKGTTGTQATFVDLFEGDGDKVDELDSLVCRRLGFDSSWAVTGQTYPRKVDAALVDVLSGIAQSASKMATDLRLLARLKEIREPMASGQVGSSAMPYKANPMRSERVCALARFLIGLAQVPAQTAATQWLERSLDDSAARRLVIPESCMAADAILSIIHNLADGLVLHPAQIRANLHAELAFMASEAILMEAVRGGGDRQVLHERLRVHSRQSTTAVLDEGLPNPYLDLIAEDPEVPLDRPALEALLDPQRFIGRAPQQVDRFLESVVSPLLEGAGSLPDAGDLEV